MEDPLPVLFASLLGLLALGSLNGQVEARAVFAFGDSLVDNGNNNYLATVARGDSPPYGIDYPGRRPTGRFSNGLNIPDIISESLGEEPTLPYLSPQLNGQRLLVGANFGSAGIGILNDTGILLGNIIMMPKQLLYFEQYQERLAALIGADAAQQRVNQALVVISLGANDFINNYYLVPFSARSRQYSLPDFVRFLISEYRKILMRLYELGVRRALVAGTGPIGCLPSELETGSMNGECNPDLVRAAELFNPQLERMLSGLNSNLGADIFIAACTRPSCFDFVYNPGAYGFVTSKIACCGQGPYNGLGVCTVLSNLCPDRTLYAFWDRFHPTEKANRIIVNNILRGSTDYMKPMNLSTILAMDPWT